MAMGYQNWLKETWKHVDERSNMSHKCLLFVMTWMCTYNFFLKNETYVNIYIYYVNKDKKQIYEHTRKYMVYYCF